MEDKATTTMDRYAIGRRAEEILLKLLDEIASDLKNGRDPGVHVAAYEALCRAEAARTG